MKKKVRNNKKFHLRNNLNLLFLLFVFGVVSQRAHNMAYLPCKEVANYCDKTYLSEKKKVLACKGELCAFKSLNA